MLISVENTFRNTDDENQTMPDSNNSSIWNYAKIFLKGIGILAVGGAAYTFVRSFTTRSSSSDENTLSAATEKTTSNSLETIYRHKRDIVPVSSEFLVNSYTADEQTFPAIASFSNGNFVIAWQSINQVNSASDYDIYAQRFANDGAKLGVEFLVNSNTLHNQMNPAVAVLSNDDLVITWESQGNPLYQIYAQRYASNGTILSDEFLVNTKTNCNTPVIAALANGDFVIAWIWNHDDIYAQRYASNGTALGSEFLVNTYMTDGQAGPAIADLANGDFVITWTSYNQATSTSGSDIYAQRYAGNGTALGGEFLVNTDITHNQYNAVIADLANGDFVITWSSSGPSYTYIRGQRFAIDGTPLGSEFSVTDSADPGIAGLANGQFMIAWPDGFYGDTKMYAQHFASNGTALGATVMVNTNTPTAYYRQFPAMVGLPNSQFVIAWQSNNQVSTTSGNDIYAKILTASYQLPFLLQNRLTIKQGETRVIELDNLLANSGSSTTFGNLLFLVSDLQHGYFARVNQAAESIFNFTQAELQNGMIQFSHDNSNASPSYQVAVDDGANTIAPQTATIDFYQRPRFIHNQFAIANGKTIQLSSAMLLATTDRNELDVSFDVEAVSHGVFSLNEATFSFANAVTRFNQSQINGTQIWFVHDGSNEAPSYSIRANCQEVLSSYQLSNINFTPDIIPARSNSKTVVAAAVGATGGALLLAGLGIFGGYRYKKAKDYAEEREKYPLANALYKVLPVKGVANFKSSKGVAFINAVNAIAGYLKVDTQQMVDEEYAELAERLARAIKAQVTFTTNLVGNIQLNIHEIEYQAEAIVQTSETLGQASSISKANELELETLKRNSNLDKLTLRLQQRGLDINNLPVDDTAYLNKLVDDVMQNFSYKSSLLHSPN